VKSPFPGMDPYIEGCGLWEDFHSHLIEKIGEKLADAAPERYLVRTGERSYVVLVESGGKKNYPILRVVSVCVHRGRKRTTKKGGKALAEPDSEAEPMTLRPFIQEEHREAFIEICEANPSQRLLTSIEVLSPSDKRPGTEGWELYQRKRQSLRPSLRMTLANCPLTSLRIFARDRCNFPLRRWSVRGRIGREDLVGFDLLGLVQECAGSVLLDQP
jgi:hypothetical protein